MTNINLDRRSKRLQCELSSARDQLLALEVTTISPLYDGVYVQVFLRPVSTATILADQIMFPLITLRKRFKPHFILNDCFKQFYSHPTVAIFELLSNLLSKKVASFYLYDQ